MCRIYRQFIVAYKSTAFLQHQALNLFLNLSFVWQIKCPEDNALSCLISFASGEILLALLPELPTLNCNPRHIRHLHIDRLRDSHSSQVGSVSREPYRRHSTVVHRPAGYRAAHRADRRRHRVSRPRPDVHGIELADHRRLEAR